MYIIGINGSPVKNGNTAFLLDRGLKMMRDLGAETDIIHVGEILNSLQVPFCINCSQPCQGICAKNTEMEKVFDMLRRADGIIVGSPVYFGSVSGQLKAFADKIRCLRGEKALLNTVGGAVSVGNCRFGGQEQTLRVIQEIMLVQGLIIVGDGHRDFDCGHHGVAAQRPAKEDTIALERIDILAKRIYEVCEATASLRK